LQIGKQTPYSRDEILYAWYGTPSASSGYSRVMLVIAMRNVVQERIDILERAGLRVESVALGTEGLAEWFRSLERQQSREGEAEILLDVDSGYSELLVFRQGEIVFTRNIMLGANHLNEAPQKWQERMVREVGHALKLYSTEDRETLVAHVFVGGAEKYRREIAEIIDARLEIDATAVVDGDEAELIVADEAVSALDVSIQAQIINLMEDLQEEFGLTYIFISHDLSVVRHISDRVGVMYLGKMMELASKKELYAEPLHPYTQALLSAVPVPRKKGVQKRERILLKGELPSPANPPKGCVFHTRCPAAFDLCKQINPDFKEVKENHFVACHLFK